MDGINALVIGDPHFKISNIRETNSMSESIIKVAKSKKIDIIVILGDTLDRHESIHVSPLTRAVKFIMELTKIAPTYLMIGNHDLKNNKQFQSDEHPFHALKYNSQINVIDKTTIITINDQIVTFVPYVAPGRFLEALNTAGDDWLKSICIFAHQEFRGAKLGAIISTEGDEWPLNYPYVVSGHIHDYDQLQQNILYTGTPIQHAFGDRHDKSISYFRFHSNNSRDHERIDLGLPKKQIVTITCNEVETYIPRDNCELKIIIRGSSAQIKAILKHRNIDIWKKLGFKIVYKDVPDNKSQELEIQQTPLKFSVILFNLINSDQSLRDLYHNLFGNPTDNTHTPDRTHFNHVLKSVVSQKEELFGKVFNGEIPLFNLN